MQKVAAYLLERRDDMHWAEARSAEAASLRSIVTNWLTSKGAPAKAPSGAYQPEDGSVGAFNTQEAVNGGRSWWMVQLDERSTEGRRFSVAVSIINTFLPRPVLTNNVLPSFVMAVPIGFKPSPTGSVRKFTCFTVSSTDSAASFSFVT